MIQVVARRDKPVGEVPVAAFFVTPLYLRLLGLRGSYGGYCSQILLHRS